MSMGKGSEMGTTTSQPAASFHLKRVTMWYTATSVFDLTNSFPWQKRALPPNDTKLKGGIADWSSNRAGRAPGHTGRGSGR